MLDDAAVRELVLLAAGVLCRRQALGSYAELHEEQVDDLAGRLLDQAGSARPPHREAVALAHRLMDDDEPELSPWWPWNDTDESCDVWDSGELTVTGC